MTRKGPRAAESAAAGLERVDDRVLAREPAGLMLGVDRRPIDDHIEDAAASADQLGVEAERLSNLGRQTGGPREIVSDAAVVNLDLHSLKAP